MLHRQLNKDQTGVRLNANTMQQMTKKKDHLSAAIAVT